MSLERMTLNQLHNLFRILQLRINSMHPQDVQFKYYHRKAMRVADQHRYLSAAIRKMNVGSYDGGFSETENLI